MVTLLTQTLNLAFINYEDPQQLCEFHKNRMDLGTYLLQYFPNITAAGWAGSITVEADGIIFEPGINQLKVLTAYAQFDPNLTGKTICVVDLERSIGVVGYMGKPPRYELTTLTDFLTYDAATDTVSVIPRQYYVVNSRLLRTLSGGQTQTTF